MPKNCWIWHDGTSSNIGVSSGLKALLEKDMPWVYWMWCLAHKLELAVSDALKNTSLPRTRSTSGVK